MADPECLAFEASKAGPERHVVAIEHDLPEAIRVVAVRHHDGRHHGTELVDALAENLELPGAHGRARRLGQPLMPAKTFGRPSSSSIRSASLRPNSRFVAGVVGKNPVALDASIASHAQYDRGDFAVFDAASAFWLMALKLSPGGSISPFCDPANVTSMPHSSCLRSIEPSEDTASTSSKRRMLRLVHCAADLRKPRRDARGRFVVDDEHGFDETVAVIAVVGQALA